MAKKAGDEARRPRPTGSPYEDALNGLSSLSPGSLPPFADPDDPSGKSGDESAPPDARRRLWLGIRPPMTARQLGLVPGTFDTDPNYRQAYTEGIILREDAVPEETAEVLVVKPGKRRSDVLAKYVRIKQSGSQLKILQEYNPILDQVVVLATPEMKKKLIEFGFEVRKFDPKTFP